MPFVKKKTNVGRLFGKAFAIGAILEVGAIISGIYFVRKYNADEGITRDS